MSDDDILGRVRSLVEREHELRELRQSGGLTGEEERAEMQRVEEALDQCWDLLRQRDGLRDAGFSVDDNEPYDGALRGDTLDEEVTRRGIAGLLVEVRQDLIRQEAAADAMADGLADVLAPVLAQSALHEPAFIRSRTGRHSQP